MHIHHIPLLITAVAVAVSGTLEAADVDFVRDVKPILSRHCWECHGAKRQESDLRLDARSTMLKGGDSGEAVVVPGKSQASRLIQLVTSTDPDEVMPPEGDRLTAKEIALLKAWIDQGAKVPSAYEDVDDSIDHWSFQPLSSSTPKVSGAWGQHPIDAFIFEKLTASKLSPSRKASRRSFIRRLYLVALGVPPSSAAIDEFESDESPLAYERLIDDVLSNPHFGERVGQHWLDLVHFGETHGFETNRERPTAWHYRDYVVSAFNDDKPYNQFVSQQIAGDSMDEPIATGFLVAGPYDIVRSKDINLTLMQRQDELADMINTTGTAFLGLTLGCARCHNHKFDPVTQVDYYSIQAVFAGVKHGTRKLPITVQLQQEISSAAARVIELRELLKPFIPKVGKGKRPALNSRHNIEKFEAVQAKFVRLTSMATNTGSEPCIDELQVWSNDKNVALASNGGKPSSSGNFPNNPLHQLKHINDGEFGNGKSWISNQNGKGWVQIEFPKVETIDRIEWQRDRYGKYSDRLAIQYKIEVAVEPGKWSIVASSNDRLPFAGKADVIVYQFDDLPKKEADRGRALEAELKSTIARQKQLSSTPVAYTGQFGMPGPTHRLYRGDPLAKREEVIPNVIEALGRLGLQKNSPDQMRRKKFAEWLVDDKNPLTARVIVNRVWQHVFGVGIVDTPSDFGGNGTSPTHPKLLDWLAADLMRSGWSLKHIYRQVFLSATFQQSSKPRAKAEAVDSDSRLLWRFPPRRLEAEAIRDSLLWTSGNLDERMQGPGFAGFVVQMENVRHFFPKESFGPGDWRRMIYMTKVRQEREDVFGAFDCPDASQVIPKRSRSTTPIQSLNLFNSKFVLQQAELFAQRISSKSDDNQKQVQLAFSLALGRTVEDDELSEAVSFIEEFGLKSLCRALFNSNEFLFIP